jgi:osmotically-inducible protein OsmY
VLLLRLGTLLALLSLLSACAAPLFIAGGAAAGVMVAKDHRSAEVMLNDERIEVSTQERITEDAELLAGSHVNITSYNGVVLISGEVVLPMYKAQIEKMVREEKGVREVRNELRIAQASSSESRRNDTVLTSRVLSRLFDTANIDSTNVKVISENATVYLMGMLSRAEAERVVQVARHTPGVARVVKVFEYTG